MDTSATKVPTGVCVSKGFKPEEKEAIGYYSNGTGGRGGRVEKGGGGTV